jgi:hypothetical protein
MSRHCSGRVAGKQNHRQPISQFDVKASVGHTGDLPDAGDDRSEEQARGVGVPLAQPCSGADVAHGSSSL